MHNVKLKTIPALAATAAAIFGVNGKAHADPVIVPVDNSVSTPFGYVTNQITMSDPNNPTSQSVTFTPDNTRHVDVYDSACDNCGSSLTSSVDYASPQTTNYTPPPTQTGGSSAMAATSSFVDTHWSGCRDVDSYTESSHWWGLWTQVFYRFHIWAHWCGDGNGAVKNVNHGQYISDVWPTISPGGYSRNDTYFYNAWPGIGDYPKSGYNIFGQQEMIIHDLPPFPDAHRYPWGQVIVFADGAEWDAQGGT